MEKQTMFMLKCLVERKTYRGGDRGRETWSERAKKRDRNLSLKCAARTGIEPMILP